MDSLFIEEDLWIEITDGKLPASDLIQHSEMFMIEHDDPGRVMINLTKYIDLLMTQRFQNRS